MRIGHAFRPEQKPDQTGRIGHLHVQLRAAERSLPFAGVFFNAATETAEGGGKTITHTSNEVEVEAKEPVAGKPHVFLGYVDEGSGHASPSGHPTPWKGESGVSFAGCGFTGTDTCAKTGSGTDIYDAGAIRIDA